MSLRIATCQFPTSADIRRNARYVLRQMREASERGAALAHFPEACLSGYPGADLPDLLGLDWGLLEERTRAIMAAAATLGIWVVVGSAHRLGAPNKPHNSVYVIDAGGRVHDRYDKRFCAGGASGDDGELAHYSPGSHTTVFSVEGVRCATLICHEYRYPELYRECQGRGVELVFHSFHAAHVTRARLARMQREVGRDVHAINPGSTILEITMPAGMIASASNNHVWISCSNSSARESCWPAFVVRPDGVVSGKLRRNVAGVLVTEIGANDRYYDSTAAWRGRAARGVFHSGRLVKDPRSSARRSL